MENIKEATNQNGKIISDELSPEIKLLILQQKRDQYLHTRYDAEIECKIANLIDDDNLKKAQVDRMKRIQKALDLINQEIAALE